MTLWNLVLSGYPGSGKTMLAEKLVLENERFARLCMDNLRRMLFNETYPCRDETQVFSILTTMRDLLLREGWSVVIDTTAPDDMIRTLLLDTKIQKVNSLLIVMKVARDTLMRRNRRAGHLNAVRVWDQYWRDPPLTLQAIRFKNNNTKEFESSYRFLKWHMEHKVTKTHAGRAAVKKR